MGLTCFCQKIVNYLVTYCQITSYLNKFARFKNYSVKEDKILRWSQVTVNLKISSNVPIKKSPLCPWYWHLISSIAGISNSEFTSLTNLYNSCRLEFLVAKRNSIKGVSVRRSVGCAFFFFGDFHQIRPRETSYRLKELILFGFKDVTKFSLYRYKSSY